MRTSPPARRTGSNLPRISSFSLATILNGLLVWAVLFPFIPAIVPSSDTQPVFLLVFILTLLVGFALPSVGSRMFRVSLWGVTLAAVATLVLYALLLFANALEVGATIPSRLFSFVQFSAAALWAYTGKYQWSSKTLYRAMLIFLVFTFIYFATGGLIENMLIRSRTLVSVSLSESGRGARTLSPEPSFFALQVFNIYILSRLVEGEEAATEHPRSFFVALVAFCLLSSFSVYGALVLLVILSAEYPRMMATAGLAVISATGVAYSYLTRWESVRAVGFVLAIVKSRGSIAKLFVLDASLASRITSFNAYVASFAEHPLIGNGFSLFQGGGFISVVAAFGILGLLFFAWVLAKLLVGADTRGTKALLLIWFALNFASGPIGIPIVGVILGIGISRKESSFRWRPRGVVNRQPVLST